MNRAPRLFELSSWPPLAYSATVDCDSNEPGPIEAIRSRPKLPVHAERYLVVLDYCSRGCTNRLPLQQQYVNKYNYQYIILLVFKVLAVLVQVQLEN